MFFFFFSLEGGGGVEGEGEGRWFLVWSWFILCTCKL